MCCICIDSLSHLYFNHFLLTVIVVTRFAMTIHAFQRGAVRSLGSYPLILTKKEGAMKRLTNLYGRVVITLIIASLLSLSLPLISGQAMAGKYDGVTINVMTFTGPQIAEPLQRRAPDFKKLTGATINVVTVPFSDLYTKLLTDWAMGTNSIDAAVFAPQWMADYVGPGYLEDLSPRIAKDKALKLDDIGKFFRDFSMKFGGKTYTITLDGDFQMAYYRSDLLEKAGMKPPQTWDDYINIAKKFHGQDLNGDGKGDYGSCIAKKRNAQSFWMITSVAAGFIQSKGTSEGAFFDTNTMKPLVNNEAFGAAMQKHRGQVFILDILRPISYKDPNHLQQMG